MDKSILPHEPKYLYELITELDSTSYLDLLLSLKNA